MIIVATISAIAAVLAVVASNVWPNSRDRGDNRALSLALGQVAGGLFFIAGALYLLNDDTIAGVLSLGAGIITVLVRATMHRNTLRRG